VPILFVEFHFSWKSILTAGTIRSYIT
jgi:hypothetical protein